MTPQRDRIAEWLGQVYADQETPFRLAYGIAQQVDTAGFIAAAAVRKLTTSDADAQAFARLVEGGHLRRARGGYRIVVRQASPVPAAAAVIPFPARRRTAYITKQAARMAELSDTHAEAHLRQQLRLQAETMERKGVDERTIAREVRSLELAIRAELWRQVLTPDRPGA